MLANLLAKKAREDEKKYKISQVVIINEEISCPNNANCSTSKYHQYYCNSQVEKSTRSALKAEFDRRSAAGTLIILDSLNYIKGFRYELYCISKASGDKHGVVWVQAGDVAKQEQITHNSLPLSSTDQEIIQSLKYRFEPPDDRNRWEKPLYLVDMSSPLLEQKAHEILDSFLLQVKALRVGISTQKPLPAASNVLHEVDTITQRISEIILTEAQKTTFAAGTNIKIPLGRNINSTSKNDIIICINKNSVHLSEMRRLRRQYMQWITHHPPDDHTELGITKNFCSYVETNLRY